MITAGAEGQVARTGVVALATLAKRHDPVLLPQDRDELPAIAEEGNSISSTTTGHTKTIVPHCLEYLWS